MLMDEWCQNLVFILPRAYELKYERQKTTNKSVIDFISN